MNKAKKDLSAIPSMEDEDLDLFRDAHNPEGSDGWTDGELKFVRPAEQLIQQRLEPRDIREIDRESRRSGIDRAQLVHSRAKGKIRHLNAQE